MVKIPNVTEKELLDYTRKLYHYGLSYRVQVKYDGETGEIEETVDLIVEGTQTQVDDMKRCG